MTQPDRSLIQGTGLLEQVRELALELPSGDPGAARLHLLLMGLVQELGRMDNELSALADEVLGDRTYSITGGIKDDRNDHADPGSDGHVPGSAGPATIAYHDAGL